MILKKLSIDNIDLRYAADTYMKFIQFSALESFVVGGCRGADTVFAQMSKPHLRPTKLKKIRWFHGEEGSEAHALEAFDGLLEAITGLEILHVVRTFRSHSSLLWTKSKPQDVFLERTPASTP